MMAASKPTSSLSKQRHILSTERYLGTLAAGLGMFPSRAMKLIPHALTPVLHPAAFGV